MRIVFKFFYCPRCLLAIMQHLMQDDTSRAIQSWTASALIHGLAVGTAMLLLSDLPGPAHDEPFVWNVTLVEPQPEPTPTPTGQPPSPPSPAKPAHPTHLLQARPTEVTPAIRTVQPVQQVHQMVRQEVSEHRPVLQEVMPAVQASSQHITETLPVQRTHEPVQREASEARPIIQEAARITQQTQQVVSQPSSPISTNRQVVSVETFSTPAVRSVSAIQSVAATQHVVEAAPQAATTATARPIGSAATQAAAIQSTPAPLQKPVVKAAGAAGTVIRDLVPTGGPASMAHGEPIQSVVRQPVVVSSASLSETGHHAMTSSSVRALYAQGSSQSPSEAEPDAEAVVERRVVVAPRARVPVTELPVRAMPGTKADFGWLANELWQRVERLKRYPRIARVHGWEGKVVVRAVIKDDGGLLQEDVEESSGYEALDQDALELVKQVCPLALRHPLGQPHVVVTVPVHYRIEQ